MPVSWETRRALGRRYSVDPALLMELQRLEEQYRLAPGREARALAESQFARNLAMQEEAIAGQEKAGMMGTIANVGLSAAMIRALTMKEGAPFFGKTIGGLFGGGTAATTPMAGVGATGVGMGAISGGAGATPFVVNPALAEYAATLAAPTAAATTGAVTPTGAVVAGKAIAPTGMMAATAPYLAPIAGGAAGGYVGSKLGVELGERIHEIPGGRREQAIGGGIIGGAAAGAAIGSVVPVVGTAVGAIIGGAVGLIGSIFGW